jgi:hypothetical protein
MRFRRISEEIRKSFKAPGKEDFFVSKELINNEVDIRCEK